MALETGAAAVTQVCGSPGWDCSWAQQRWWDSSGFVDPLGTWRFIVMCFPQHNLVTFHSYVVSCPFLLKEWAVSIFLENPMFSLGRAGLGEAGSAVLGRKRQDRNMPADAEPCGCSMQRATALCDGLALAYGQVSPFSAGGSLRWGFLA